MSHTYISGKDLSRALKRVRLAFVDQFVKSRSWSGDAINGKIEGLDVAQRMLAEAIESGRPDLTWQVPLGDQAEGMADCVRCGGTGDLLDQDGKPRPCKCRKKAGLTDE